MTRSADRFFDPNPEQRAIALELYNPIANLPLICPHGHVDPLLFADPNYTFGSPVELFIIPDHYIFRMLYSQGIPMESLGIERLDGEAVEADQRKIWQTFADHYYLFRGTPTGLWLNEELIDVFGVEEKLKSETAQSIYDQIADKLTQPEFRPRALYERFNVEALTTTDAASDTLEHHQSIRDSGWTGRILPTFRPDAVVNLDTVGWRAELDALSAVSGIDIDGYPAFLRALEERRAFFRSMGAVATDHAALTPYTADLTDAEADLIFQRALKGDATPDDAHRFTGHMLMEMARMSSEDGLVMQLHVGSYRNHNPLIFQRFGANMGADMPVRSNYTRELRPLLEKYGNHPDLSLILFTLDETAYGRELAPLAGHYPTLKLGPPWWFYDSLNGMQHFFDQVMETTGIYNTVGFNDDTRAFPSIPSRHDLWRRAAANWLAGLVVRRLIDMEDAAEMATAMAYTLAKDAYKIG